MITLRDYQEHDPAKLRAAFRTHVSARPWFIYTLKDPRTDEVRYVGWTVDLKRRLRLQSHDPSQGELFA